MDVSTLLEVSRAGLVGPSPATGGSKDAYTAPNGSAMLQFIQQSGEIVASTGKK